MANAAQANVDALVVSAYCYNTRRNPRRITTGITAPIPVPASSAARAQPKKQGHEFGPSRKKGRLLPLVCPRCRELLARASNN